MMAMATVSSKCTMKEVNRGGWTAEEDQKLAQAIEIHGPKRWKSVAAKAGLNRCGNSCRLRWMNYLRPNIKRGNISEQEEDLILRLHTLLGNRWSLIAGRLPGRTDNEIKNYWNCHLSKKLKPNEKLKRGSKMQQSVLETDTVPKGSEEGTSKRDDHFTSCFNIDDTSMDFYSEGSLNLEWTNQFPELDETWFNYS